MRRIRWAILGIALGAEAASAASAGWSPKLAASYLDERQKEWFAWAPAAKPGGPCMSCHTGLPYLIARPALRRVLGESAPTQWETGLRDAMRARLDGYRPERSRRPRPSRSGRSRSWPRCSCARRGGPRPAMEAAVEGRARREAAWNWFELELDPVGEHGSAVLRRGVGGAGGEGRAGPRIGDRAEALIEYLKRTSLRRSRCKTAWRYCGRRPARETRMDRGSLQQAGGRRRMDGGSDRSLEGPRRSAAGIRQQRLRHGIRRLAMLEAGVKPADPRMARALGWLRSHQDAKSGYWDAVSMNKRYEPGSMPEQFMRDAATGFAAAALVKAEEGAR